MRAITAQAMRAVLFAIATVVSRFDLLARSERSQAPVADGFVSARRMTDVAPITRRRLRYPSPIFEIRPSLSLPPDEFCLGVSPRKGIVRGTRFDCLFPSCCPDFGQTPSMQLQCGGERQETIGNGIIPSRFPLTIPVKDLALCATKVEMWPKRPRDKLAAQIRRVSELRAVLQSTAAAGSQRLDKVSGASQVDIVSIVMLKLMSKPIPNLSEEEERVCTALRKSKGKLKKASNEMLSEYIRLERLSRLKDRLKKVRRIYAKLAKHHGSEGLCEEHTVAFVESPDQSGLEVLTFDERTSTASSFSISSFDRAHFLGVQHNELERSEDLPNWEDAKDELAELSLPQAWQEAEILENLSLAAVITLARNAGFFLSGQKISKTAKRKMIDQTVHTVGIWGLTDLVT